MESPDYKTLLLEIVSLIKDKASYLKTVDGTSDTFDENHFDGMAEAYHFVLDGVKTHLECYDNLELDDFGLKDFDPDEILDYKPKG